MSAHSFRLLERMQRIISKNRTLGFLQRIMVVVMEMGAETETEVDPAAIIGVQEQPLER